MLKVRAPIITTTAILLATISAAQAAEVVIVQNSVNDPGGSADEVAAMQAWLTDLGHTSTVFSPTTYTQADLLGAGLVIYNDGSFAFNGVVDADVTNFKAAFDANIPIYFIGDDLGFVGGTNLSEPFQPIWNNLVKLNPASDNGPGGGTLSITAGAHPIIAGPYGTVANGITLNGDPDVVTALNAGEILVGTRDGDAVLLAFDGGTVRTVTQNFLISPSDIAQTEVLFKNSVAFLVVPEPSVLGLGVLALPLIRRRRA